MNYMIENHQICKDWIKRAWAEEDKTKFGLLDYHIYRLHKQIILNPI